MDMKQLEISKLMDEYQDNEFFPSGGSIADAQAIKTRVLSQASTTKKRRTPPLKAVLLVAALGLVSVLCIAAGLPQRVFHLATGETLIYESGNGLSSRMSSSGQRQDPIILEKNRVWLTVGGERTDITDLIDEETPYIYDSTDPETGYRQYLIVGGTPDDCGWSEYYEVEDNIFAGNGNGNCYTVYFTIDGVTYEEDELTPVQRERTDHYVWNNDEGIKVETVWRPWLVTAKKQLGIQ